MSSPPEARPASTVILARRAQDGGYEVLMTKRPDSMRFMGGTFVFPGGALDDAECDAAMEPVSALSPAQARAKVGEDIDLHVAHGLFSCAVRELFEEAGVLLATTSQGAPVDPDVVARDYLPRRDEVAHDPLKFAAFLREQGLVMATDKLVWHGRLITPESSPIRFDARFFVAPFPDGQTVVPDAEEVADVRWISPADAVEAARAERMPIPIPTMSIIEGLAEVPGYEQLMQGTRVVREIRTGGLGPLVSYVIAPNPGLMTGPGTNTYIVGEGEVVVIDPAVPDPLYIQHVVAEADKRGRVSRILLTHMHPDHTGGASVLAEHYKCPVAAWKGVKDVSYVTEHLDHEDEIKVGGGTLKVLYTPGHASHHVSFVLREEDAAFVGDLVAGLGTVVIGPPDGNMAHYLDSLALVRDSGVRRLLCGHGPAVEDGPSKLTEYIQHRKAREAQVVAALEAGNQTLPDIVKHVYTDVSPALHPVAQGSVRAHLEMLQSQGRVARQEIWSLSPSTGDNPPA